MTSSLVAFLNARYDETEAWARQEPVVSLAPPTAGGVYFGRWVLLDLEAKRAVLTLHHPVGDRFPESPARDACDGCNSDDQGYWVEHTDRCPTLRALALAFRAHPDYLADWAPQEA